MSILFIHGSSDLYGSARILLQIVKLTISKGHKAIVVLPHEGMISEELRSLGVQVKIINTGVLRRKYFTPWGILGRFFLWISSSLFIVKLIKKEQINAIYINSANVIIGPFLKMFSGIRLIWHLHEIVERPKVLTLFLGKLISLSDSILAVSQATQVFWQKQFSHKQINLIYNGIDISPFMPLSTIPNLGFPFDMALNENKQLICLIGRIQPWKGQSYFLEIIKNLLDRYPELTNSFIALIIGDPYPGCEHFAEDLSKQIVQLNLSDHVKYLGFRQDIPAILQQIDLLAMTSTSPDPLPTVVLEAMASSKPVVATAQGGAMEMVLDQVTGLFFPIDNPYIAADQIAILLKDKVLAQKMGINGYVRISKMFSQSTFEHTWSSFVLSE